MRFPLWKDLNEMLYPNNSKTCWILTGHYSRLNRFVSILAILIGVHPLSNGQVNQPSFEFQIAKQDSIILFIDPLKISNESDRAKVYLALGLLALKNNHTETFVVKQNYGFYNVIADRYRYSDSKFPATTEAIYKAIKISSPGNVILINEQITIPTLPVKPQIGSSARYVQYEDVYESKSFVAPILSAIVGNPTATNVPSSKAKYISYKLTKSDYEAFKQHVGVSVLFNNSSAFRTAGDPEVVKINFPSLSDSSSRRVNNVKIDPELLSIIKGIDYSYYGKIVVLDFFGDCQSHGEKVIDVMRIILNTYGIPSVEKNIVRQSINYYNNEDLSFKTIEDYYKNEVSLDKDIAEQELKKLKELKRANRKYCSSCTCTGSCSCDQCIPVLLLRTLLNIHYDHLTTNDIISTSIYASVAYSTGGVGPRYRDNGPTLITAALDSPNRTVESLTEVSSAVNAIEPLYSYYMTYSRTGNVIVGARIGTHDYFGMYSTCGSGITTLGQGNGWANSCIKVDDKGTSFATPEISISLLIANAFWRSRNLDKINPKEARKRLLLSSDMDSSFVGKFGSGGSINLGKLLKINGYVEFKTGEVKEATILPNSTITFGKSTVDFKRRFHLPKSDGNEICGLSFSGDKSLIFDEDLNCWIRKDNIAVNLKLRIGDKAYDYTSLDSLKKDIVQVVSLK